MWETNDGRGRGRSEPVCAQGACLWPPKMWEAQGQEQLGPYRRELVKHEMLKVRGGSLIKRKVKKKGW